MNKYNEPWVSVVLVNYNGWQDTIECIESLVKLNYSNYHIIIVDNASSNDSVNKIINWSKGEFNCNFSLTMISKEFAFPPIQKPLPILLVDASTITTFQPELVNTIILFQSQQNKGFAGGNNIGTKIGIDILKSDFIWYLNNDTIVKPDALTNLVNCYQQKLAIKTKVGIIGSKLLYYSDPERIQAIGGLYQPCLGLTKHVGGNEIDTGQYDNLNDSSKIDYVIGASMFVSASFIEEVGYMSTEYFLYFEEIDWTIRGKMKGYEIAFCSESIVYHKEGASIGGDTKGSKEVSFLSDYYNKKNRILITKKYYAQYLPIIYLTFIGVIINRLMRRKYKRIIPFIGLLFGREIKQAELSKRSI